MSEPVKVHSNDSGNYKETLIHAVLINCRTVY
jgi:hypothetical protein